MKEQIDTTEVSVFKKIVSFFKRKKDKKPDEPNGSPYRNPVEPVKENKKKEKKKMSKEKKPEVRLVLDDDVASIVATLCGTVSAILLIPFLIGVSHLDDGVGYVAVAFVSGLIASILAYVSYKCVMMLAKPVSK